MGQRKQLRFDHSHSRGIVNRLPAIARPRWLPMREGLAMLQAGWSDSLYGGRRPGLSRTAIGRVGHQRVRRFHVRHGLPSRERSGFATDHRGFASEGAFGQMTVEQRPAANFSVARIAPFAETIGVKADLRLGRSP
jgi:hypothetical protein